MTNTVRNSRNGKYCFYHHPQTFAEVQRGSFRDVDIDGHTGVCRESETRDDVAIRWSERFSSVLPITWLSVAERAKAVAVCVVQVKKDKSDTLSLAIDQQNRWRNKPDSDGATRCQKRRGKGET